MRRFIGLSLVVLGIGLIALCFKLHSQFQELAASLAPQPDDYPLLKPFIADVLAPSAASASRSGNPPKPSEIADMISMRISAVGGVGLVLVIAGVIVLFIRRKRREDHEAG